MISLIHPSRGRARKASETMDYWWENSGYDDFEHILSLDTSDHARLEYAAMFDNQWSLVIYNNNQSVVEATNKAIPHAEGDIFIYLSDDFKCPTNWGSLIAKEFEGVTEPMLLKVDDCLQKFHVPVLTIPIMNRALYEKLGYFWNPLYKSMWVDCDLFETCKRIGAIKYAEHLKFPHEHHSIGKSDNDETYKASEKNWNQGLEVFNKRRQMGFPI